MTYTRVTGTNKKYPGMICAMVRGQWTPVNNPREEYPLCLDQGKNKCPDCPRHDLYYKGATDYLVECVNCGSQFTRAGS